MQKLLSQDQAAFYRDRGYHFPVDVLSTVEVAEFRRKLEDYEAASGGPIKGEMRHRSHVLFTWINEMVRHPRILDAVEDLLGPSAGIPASSSRKRTTPASSPGIRMRPIGA